jgi:hypothetical protein
MQEIPTSGTSHFGDDISPTFADTDNLGCVAKGDPAPAALCVSTPLTRVIETPVGHHNVIYGIPPAEGIQCLGNGVDNLALNMNDGWACAAARGSDRLGNLNVSAPLRMCIDSNQDGNDGCPAIGVADLINAPNCTGTYDPQTDTVDLNTPCTPRLVYPDNVVRRIDL